MTIYSGRGDLPQSQAISFSLPFGAKSHPPFSSRSHPLFYEASSGFERRFLPGDFARKITWQKAPFKT